MKSLIHTTIATAAALALAGCGGGGSGGSPAPASGTVAQAAGTTSGSGLVAGSDPATDAGSGSDTGYTSTGSGSGSGTASTSSDSGSDSSAGSVSGSSSGSASASDSGSGSGSGSGSASGSGSTWQDADCSHTTTALPACSENLSDGDADVVVVADGDSPVIEVETDGTPPSSGTGHGNNGNNGNSGNNNGGGKGHKASFGLNFLHRVKLSDFPGISFKMKRNSGGTGGVGGDDVYVTYSISLACDGAGDGVTLVTVASSMAAPGTMGDDGYATYTVVRGDNKWLGTGSKPIPETGTPLLNGEKGNGGGPLTLYALIAAHPDACIYNLAKPNGGVHSSTSGVVFNFDQAGSADAKKSWIKNIQVGDKIVF